MANQQRQRRVADQIQRELAGIIRLELKDPGVGLVTITAVEMSPDLAHAKVYFTCLGSDVHREQAEAGLRRAAGFLRGMLGRLIKIHNTPELHFAYDDSIENGMRISRLIDEAVAPASPRPASRKAR